MSILSPDPTESDYSLENGLRPSSFSELIGLEKEKKTIQIMISSAKKTGKPLDHILFHGPPGLGKTSIAMVIAKEMGVNIRVTTGPSLTKPGDLAAILTSLEDGTILFIDEIHRISSQVEETLYPAMEDRVLDVIIGKGPSARTLRLDLPAFTIVAATTKVSMLSAPLRDRFGVDFRLDFYNNAQMQEIIMQKARKLSISILPEAAKKIAEKSRMTARVAVRILKRVYDMAIVDGKQEIDEDTVERVLTLLEIDELGLDQVDRKILKTLHYKFSDKPIGLNTLAAAIAEETRTVEEVYEPFLLRSGLIERTPRGRTLTVRAIEYLNKLPKEND